MSGISSAFSAVPVVGSAVSGTIGMLSSIVGLGASPAPLPLTESQLEGALETVLRAELKRHEAKHASRGFLRAHAYLTEIDELAASHTGLGPHEIEDFHRNLEDYLWQQSDLHQSLDFLAENPKEAMAVSSAYMLGISAYVKMLVYHFLIGKMAGDPLMPDRLGKLYTKIWVFHERLGAVAREAEAAIMDALGRKLFDCSNDVEEAKELKAAIFQYYTGFDSTDPILAYQSRLEEV